MTRPPARLATISSSRGDSCARSAGVTKPALKKLEQKRESRRTDCNALRFINSARARFTGAFAIALPLLYGSGGGLGFREKFVRAGTPEGTRHPLLEARKIVKEG